MTRSDWQKARADHQAAVDYWLKPHLDRRRRGLRHPVYDFLFDYYSLRPSKLRRWSPGAGDFLADTSPQETDFPAWFKMGESGCRLQRLPGKRRPFACWTLDYLEKTGAREPLFHCHGLHEWAMVYRENRQRHETVPMRLGREEIDQVVERLPLVCTHFDAFRFFTPPAIPRNGQVLTRDNSIDFDQPGCIHVTMDLYKSAYKLMPWIGSELLRQTFELAAAAREIDMRASPYDLHEWKLAPIPVETAAGRSEYAHHQRILMEQASPVRRRLMKQIEKILAFGAPEASDKWSEAE